MAKVISGVSRFYQSVYKPRQSFFKKLGRGQTPSVLFIGCSDSRICPNMLLQADPGEVFVIRNAGNIIPPESEHVGSEMATVEFALSSFPIADIIICGHSGCGAVTSIVDDEQGPEPSRNVKRWLQYAVSKHELAPLARHGLSRKELIASAVQANLLKQVNHLKTNPMVERALSSKCVTLHAWYYDISQGRVLTYDFALAEFLPVVNEVEIKYALEMSNS